MSPAAAFLLLSLAGPLAPSPTTETVLVTHRVREGADAEYVRLLALQWSTLRRLGLVLEHPHVILRGDDESGKPIFVEVLTWRDHDAPDNVPPEVEKIWAQMQARTEPRHDRSGIEFPEFQLVAADDCGAKTKARN